MSQEEPPGEFRVEYHWKAQGASYGRFDFFNTMVLQMASMALKVWDSGVLAIKFPSPYGIAMGFASSRSGPGFRVKHIIWALEDIFDIIVEHDRFLSGQVIVDLGPTTLGVGNVYTTVLADSGPVNSSGTVTGDFARTNIGGLTLNSTWPPSNNTVPYKDPNIIKIPNSLSSQISDASVHLGAHGNVNLRYWYRTGGAPLNDAQVYNATLKLLIKVAEPVDKKGDIWPGISTYNDMDDFTLTLRPNGIEHRTDVSWLDMIFALSTIPVMMYRHTGPPGTFKELDGTINLDHVIVGRFCIDKGNKTGLEFMDVCNVENQGSGDGEAGVASV